ncbi:MAG TPA: type II toxin-antitoxin system HicB family antitoxin [Stellaceae bacterium]|jgi:antitoxin HicB
MYAVILAPDDSGALLVTCPDLPEVTTFGEDQEDAMQRASDAIEEALAARIDHREDIPTPTVEPQRTVKLGRRKIRLSLPAPPCEPDRRMVRLPPLTKAKVELYRAMRADGVSKAELGRRLGWHGPQVDRLFDLNHRSTIEHLDQALRAIGKRLDLSVLDAAQ